MEHRSSHESPSVAKSNGQVSVISGPALPVARPTGGETSGVRPRGAPDLQTVRSGQGPEVSDAGGRGQMSEVSDKHGKERDGATPVR